MKPKIRIDVVSDVVCPWCYIGKRRLEKAMTALGDKFEFEVAYHPFELNPGQALEGVNQKEYLSDKFGGEARYDQLTGQVTQVAATEGIVFDYEKQQISPNTRAAHRMAQLAGEEGVQQPVIEALFKAYFTDGVDLSKKDNLVAIGASAGLDAARIEKLLDSDDKTAEVIASEKQMQQLGITGVPFYIINNKYGISGAQQPQAFIEAFTQVSLETVAAESTGDACSVDGKDC
jgi:predicted DsbA family dithiol-disulfide isomerase